MVNNYQCCGASAYPSMNPCPTTAISYGDARDYTVNIVPAGPVITATPASLSFGTIAAGTTSSPQNGVIAGAYLSPAAGNLTVTAPTDFEVCSTSGGTYANSYTIAYTGATVSATSVFVRYVAPSTPGSSGGNVVISGGSATANIAVAGSAGCSGTPASGGTSGLFYSGGACATAPSITLNNTGYTADPGIVFQWQSSPTGSSSWANISGATNAFSVVTGAGTTTYYRCVVTCSLSGLSTNSTTSGDTIDRVKGRIAYAATAPDTLDTKVWLIYHNVSAGTLTAIDSVTTCLDGGVAYYEFNGMGTGSYIVKGKVLDASSTVVGASGFVPTYGASNPHWDTAVTVTHTVATTDSMDINMVYGTVPAGPGFIGGLITSGAGKNTASDIPAANMIVFLMDAAHHVLTHTYTNATGNYSFGSIAYGNYYIYPEDLNYTTTPSAMLPLSSGTASLPAINFKQHTGAKTITPNMGTSVTEIAQASSDCVVFPNPATSELTLKMGEGSFTSLAITNSMGAVVMNQSINKASITLEIKNLATGIYYIRLTGSGNNVVKMFVKQ